MKAAVGGSTEDFLKVFLEMISFQVFEQKYFLRNFF